MLTKAQIINIIVFLNQSKSNIYLIHQFSWLITLMGRLLFLLFLFLLLCHLFFFFPFRSAFPFSFSSFCSSSSSFLFLSSFLSLLLSFSPPVSFKLHIFFLMFYKKVISNNKKTISQESLSGLVVTIEDNKENQKLSDI